MELVIDINDPEPLYAQLVSQIKDAVRTGAIAPGDPLPSIRQLSTDLEMNSKTVAKAYRLLERDAVIQARGYRGTFVHPDAARNSTTDISGWLNETLANTIADLRDGGATDSEIRIAFTHVMNERNNGGA
ncbi:MAG: GntR family transcriptional regulator [Gammaproteobacteria bacterium]|nr:GntR family transcriptional regulator [Gammaproteobacteria bacterium]